MVAMGWYNWARFDSPLEFGYRYQITILDLNKQSGLLFQPDYFFLNLYNYIFQPFEVISKFPFLQPMAMTSQSLAEVNMVMPKIYFAGRMTGLLVGAPFLVFSMVHLFPRSEVPHTQDSPADFLPYNLVVFLLAGSFIIGFLSIVFFFFAQMRYIVDVLSQITFLAILGYWRLISLWQESRPVRSGILQSLGVILILITICAGLLLAVSSDYNRLETLNPVLFEKIANSLSIHK
jgi:hypothetical protein